MILSWMREAGHLDEAVEQVVEQARLLRESVQTLIERQEHLVDQERQRSNRVMEWALGLLTFVGIPLSVLLELWINWSVAQDVKNRSWAWWLAGLGMLVGAVTVGSLLALAFRVRLWPPPVRPRGRGGRSQLPSTIGAGPVAVSPGPNAGR